MTDSLERGRLLYAKRFYERARQELQQALSEDPEQAGAHALLGLCCLHLGRLSEAVERCRQAVALQPNGAFLHYALSFVLDDTEAQEETAREAREAVRLNPTAPDYRAHLSYVLIRQNRHEEALAVANEGLQLDGQHLDCLLRRGLALAHLGHSPEAEEALRTALAIAPDNALLLASLGWVLVQGRQMKAAIPVLRAALRRDPNLRWARETVFEAMGWLLERQRPGIVLPHFDEAFRRDPNLAEGRQRLVQALLGPSADGITAVVWMVWLIACLALADVLGGSGGVFGFVLAGLLLFNYSCLLPQPLTHLVQALLLRLQPLGRLLITEEHRRFFHWVGGAAALAVASAVVALVRRTGVTIDLCVLLVTLLQPLAYVILWPAGMPRKCTGAFLGALLAGGATLLALDASGRLTPEALVYFRRALLVLGAGCAGPLAHAVIYLAQRRSFLPTGGEAEPPR